MTKQHINYSKIHLHLIIRYIYILNIYIYIHFVIFIIFKHMKIVSSHVIE